MREFVRPVAVARSVACLAAAIAIASAGEVLAQAGQAPPQQTAPAPQAAPAQQPAVKQVALTDKQIKGVLAAQKDRDAITAKLVDNAKPDPTMAAQFEGVATKNGFAIYDEYSNVVDNIGIVLAGFDPATKQYVGTECRDQGADRAGRGRQKDVAQRQEGSAEVARRADREQGQYRSGRKILRQAFGRSRQG